MPAAAALSPLPSRPLAPRRHALLTVDVEDWFHMNYRSWSPPPGWDPPRRVMEATRRVLDLLAAHGRRGTFFVLAAAARGAPGLVRAIAAAGHEVACHGLEHTLLYASDRVRVERELRDARRVLEDELGAPVVGFRAPSWSITRPALWALDAIAAAGFRYDATSSRCGRASTASPKHRSGRHGSARPAAPSCSRSRPPWSCSARSARRTAAGSISASCPSGSSASRSAGGSRAASRRSSTCTRASSTRSSTRCRSV
jgi:peptidoglycan/xylan/chitin deacetylase (PgdA/CDA1 family)